jgi:hypothetical protein
LHKKPESVTLLTVVNAEVPHMSAVAMYDADNPESVAWVKRAEAVSEELWQTLAERRKGAAR